MSDKQLETVPSPAATYRDQRTFGVVAGKSHVEIAPKYGGEFKAGDIIRLEIPAQSWLDPNEFYISFQTSLLAGASNSLSLSATDENVLPYQSVSGFIAASPTRTGNRTVQFLPGIQNIFNRVRLLAGSVVIEDIQDYPTLYRIMLETTTNELWRKTDGFVEEGWYDPADPMQMRANGNFHTKFGGNTANPGHTYTVRPLLGLLNSGKYLPLKYMGQLIIELYLEQNQECLWSSSSIKNTEVDEQVWAAVSATAIPSKEITTGALEHLAVADSTQVQVDYPNASYIVKQVRMHVPFVFPNENFDEEMMKQIESQGLEIHHSSWMTHTKNLTNTGRNALNFQERALSIKGGLCVMRNSKSIRSIANDMTFASNGIESYQFKVGSEYIPAQQIDCLTGPGPALAQLKYSLGTFGTTNVGLIDNDSFLPADVPHQLDTMNASELRRKASQPSKFIMGLNLEKSPGQSSGFNSAASSVDIELILKLRDHKTVVGANDGNKLFKGAEATAKWQPTKRVVINQHDLDFGSSLTNRPDPSFNGYWYDDDTGTRVSRYFLDRPEGFLHADNLTTKYTAGVSSTVFDEAELSYTANEVGHYCRVYFFAHVDQVLRLSAVGRMEIVR